MAAALASCSTGPAVRGEATPTTSAPITVPPTTGASSIPSIPTVTTTTDAPAGSWAERTIAGTGVVEDVAPTADALYWLSLPGPGTGITVTATPVRYDLLSGVMTRGPALTGVLDTPALTVTGDRVWVVIEANHQPLLAELDPVTMALLAQHVLPVQDTVSPDPVPLLSATVDGPLWVADGEEVWSVDPTTGAVETEFDAGYQVDSLSTDPTGRVLYIGGRNADQAGMEVTEYDADNGQEIIRSSQEDSVGGGSVAATTDGVWISYRTGMAGPALELSSGSLNQIEPPPSQLSPFGTFDQIMGVASGVSEGVLWLTSVSDLTCADPVTGAVRASETAGVTDPIASGPHLYALSESDVVEVITPPAACFAAG